MGRPSSYTDDTADKICSLLAEGIPLKKICRLDGMPSYTTVLKWQRDIPEFADLSARAKIEGTHALADEVIEIADDPTIDPADKRVRIDARLRLIGKWNRAVYGERVEQHNTIEKIDRIEIVVIDPLLRDITPDRGKISS